MTDPEIPRHHKRSAGRKRCGIEYRAIIGEPTGMMSWFREWRIWKRYRTEAKRDKALVALRQKGGVWEYRKEKDHAE